MSRQTAVIKIIQAVLAALENKPYQSAVDQHISAELRRALALLLELER